MCKYDVGIERVGRGMKLLINEGYFLFLIGIQEFLFVGFEGVVFRLALAVSPSGSSRFVMRPSLLDGFSWRFGPFLVVL